MTAPATLPDTAPPDDDDDDVEHIFCCDPDRSLCGVDISDDVEHNEDCDCGTPPCPWCEALEKLNLPCGPDCKGAGSP